MTPQENRRAQEAILILDKNRTKKTQSKNGVQFKSNYTVVVKGEYFKSHGINGGYFLNGNNGCVWGTRYHGSGCSQCIHSDQHATKERCLRKGNHENNRCSSIHDIGTW